MEDHDSVCNVLDFTEQFQFTNSRREQYTQNNKYKPENIHIHIHLQSCTIELVYIYIYIYTYIAFIYMIFTYNDNYVSLSGTFLERPSI